MEPDEDPFGLMDSERTQVRRPTPGGRTARAAPAAPHPPRRAPPPIRISGTPGRGPLVAAAFGLLSLVPLLRARTPPALPEELRARVEEDLRAFSEGALAQGIDQRAVALGHYALCALIDDVVLNTPWGAHGYWKGNTLAGALHHDAAAGERFFAYLDQVRAQPERNRPVLELMAACLALGFEGRTRLAPQGAAALRQLSAEVFTALRRLDGPAEPELSPHWRGAAAAHVPVARRIPPWVFGSAALALLVLAWAGLEVRLGGLGGRLDAAVAALPPAAPVRIQRAVGAPAMPVVAPAVPRAVALEPRLRACLPPPARDAADSVTETLQGLRIRLPDAALFASGSAELVAGVATYVGCLARVLAEGEGRVSVIGHTDSIPIRTARFPDNWALSRARAEAVAVVLRPGLGPARLAVAGRGESEPLASNATEEGRSRNRRVEVLLLR